MLNLNAIFIMAPGLFPCAKKVIPNRYSESFTKLLRARGLPCGERGKGEGGRGKGNGVVNSVAKRLQKE